MNKATIWAQLEPLQNKAIKGDGKKLTVLEPARKVRFVIRSQGPVTSGEITIGHANARFCAICANQQFPVNGKDSTRQSCIPFFSLAPVSEYDSDCRTLDVQSGASLEEIREAYRDQTKIWHPDRFSNDIRLQKKAEEKLKLINLAYQRLCGGGPYEPPVLNPPTERYPSEWIAVFVALRRALRKSVIAITKPFRLLIAKTVNESNKLFQWCRRQRRSLGVATTAFLLGFASGVWFLPHKSEIWAKINNLRQKIIEKAHGTAQVAVAKPSPTAPTVLSQRRPLTASSSKTVVPAPPPSIATSSSPPIARLSGDVFPWKTAVATAPERLGQGLAEELWRSGQP
jgi:DnaJ domain